MTEPSGGVAAGLVAELEGGGALVDDGRFTIDANEARRKLEQFQVGDPHAWVLILIEAAALAGQTPIHITLEPMITVELGPIPLAREQLTELFAAAFVDLRKHDEPERTRRRVVQKLAVACNAALRCHPRELEVEVVDEHEVVRLALVPDPDRPTLAVSPRTDADPLGVRVRMRPSLIDGNREAELIRERCRYSALEIVLDGVRVSVGHARALHTDTGAEQVMFRSNARKVRPLLLDDRPIGLAGLRLASQAAAEIVILVNGVFAERRSIADGQPEAPGFMAIVELDLPKDLSQTQLSHGPELARVIAQVRELHDRITAGRRLAGPSVAERSHEPLGRTDVSELERTRNGRIYAIVRNTILIATGLIVLGLIVEQPKRALAWVLLLAMVSGALLTLATGWKNSRNA